MDLARCISFWDSSHWAYLIQLERLSRLRLMLSSNSLRFFSRTSFNSSGSEIFCFGGYRKLKGNRTVTVRKKKRKKAKRVSAYWGHIFKLTFFSLAQQLFGCDLNGCWCFILGRYGLAAATGIRAVHFSNFSFKLSLDTKIAKFSSFKM